MPDAVQAGAQVSMVFVLITAIIDRSVVFGDARHTNLQSHTHELRIKSVFVDKLRENDESFAVSSVHMGCRDYWNGVNN
ncbi:MAG: hypothetical protein MJA29_05330 [Candidatus Omnitrophica bacterium]|nr:hypothetical protein [Candidatus Omnitrophota bacterium]